MKSSPRRPRSVRPADLDNDMSEGRPISRQRRRSGRITIVAMPKAASGGAWRKFEAAFDSYSMTSVRVFNWIERTAGPLAIPVPPRGWRLNWRHPLAVPLAILNFMVQPLATARLLMTLAARLFQRRE